MALIIKPFDLTNGTPADANEVEAIVDALYTLVNGNIDADNLAADAVGTDEIQDDSISTVKIQDGAITDNKILFGTGANEVSAVDIPIEDAGGNYGTDNVEAALTQIGTEINNLENKANELEDTVIPIGSIIPFYDFNAALTFDSSRWKYCDGQTHDFGGAVGVQTLPDLSNRYLVGFGTEGGEDIDTASWATAAVGNTSHQINLQHSHTVNSHTHDLSNHTHTGPSHTHDLSNHTHTGPSHNHGPGTLQFITGGYQQLSASNPTSKRFSMYNEDGSSEEVFDNDNIGASGSGFNAVDFRIGTLPSPYGKNYYTASGSGTTSSAGTGNTGAPSNNTSGSAGTGTTGAPSNNTSGSASPGTNNQLSTTQSIQPRSIRVRFLMRVA